MTAPLGPVRLVHRERRPDFGPVGELKPVGHDPDHRVHLVIELDLAAECIVSPCESSLPKRVAQDYDALRAQIAFRGRKGASDCRLRSDDPEKVGGDAGSANPLGLGAAHEVEAAAADGGDARKAAVVISKSQIITRRQGELGKPGFEVSLAHHHQFFRLFVTQRRQQDRVDDREYRGIGTDSEGEGQHGNGGETWVPRHRADCIAGILQHRQLDDRRGDGLRGFSFRWRPSPPCRSRARPPALP